MSEERKVAVSTDRYATALLVTDSADALTYGEVVEVSTTLITAKYTPKMNSKDLYASGIAVDSYIAKCGGELDIQVAGLSIDDESRYFGATVNGSGLMTSGKSDIVPDRMVIYSTKRSDGTLNLYKFLKAKFTSQGEQAETEDDSGVKYNTNQLKATYKNTIYNGNDMHKIVADPRTAAGAALIAAWFGSAMGGITTSAVITPIAATFDLNTSGADNKNLVFKLENSTLSAVKNGTTALAAGTDYVYDSAAETVTLLRTYLDDLTAGSTPIIFTFETADDTNPTAAITVVNTSTT